MVSLTQLVFSPEDQIGNRSRDFGAQSVLLRVSDPTGNLMVNSFAVDTSIFLLPQGLVHLDFLLYFVRGRGDRSNF